MQLRELHIDGFGVFADARVRGLTSGLNIIYGRNEFGKTTLLEFIRRVLFGFPARRGDTNQYLPLRGGQHGGRLVCEMRDGRTMTVSRIAGKGTGVVTIRTANGADLSEPAFSAMLGHVTDELYRNVFAVSLLELQAAKQLQGEELRSRIYGAGLGLGEVSIPDLKKSFTEMAEKLYKPRGSTPLMNDVAGKLIDIERRTREISKQLGHYDARKKELDGCAADEAQLRKRQSSLQAEQRSLDRQLSLYGNYVGLHAAEQALKPLADLRDIPDAALDELRRRQQSIASLESRLQDARDRQEKQRTDLGALAFDAALMEHESDIKSLSQSLAQYRDAQRDLPVRIREQELAREQVGRSIRELGDEWTEERVRSFALSSEQRDAVHTAEDALRSAEKAEDKARDRLEDHRSRIHDSLARPPLPTIYRGVGLAILGLGAAGCVYSALNGNTIPAIVSGTAGALGLVVALSLGSSTGPLGDKGQEQLEAEQEERSRQLAGAQTDWSACLAALGLESSLSPDAVREQLQLLSRVQDGLRTIGERESRIESMRAVVKTTAGLFAKVVARLSEPVPGTDVAAGIEVLDRRLDDAQELRARKIALLRETKQLEESTAALATTLQAEKVKLAAFLADYQVASAEDLATLHERSARARALRVEIGRSLAAIQTAVGIGAPCDAFLATLQSMDPEETRARLDRIVSQLADVNTRLEEAIRCTTALGRDLDTLESGEDLLTLESEAETLRQQLRDAHRDWLRTQLALWAIEQAISTYETTRQPAVIREAQTAFALITGGKYTTLLNPLGSDDLRVRDASGSEKSVLNELSRGTREQLYLAMRLGLIEQYEQNAEPLPVIMDDILVNFDDARGPLAVKALAEFAKGRQVIVMTCHDATRRLYLDAGATEVQLDRSRVPHENASRPLG